MGGREPCTRARGGGVEDEALQVVHQARVPGWCGYDVEVGVGM